MIDYYEGNNGHNGGAHWRKETYFPVAPLQFTSTGHRRYSAFLARVAEFDLAHRVVRVMILHTVPEKVN